MKWKKCFICREWGWDVQVVLNFDGVHLCMPCYVDVLQVRQGRGAPSEPDGDVLREGPDQSEAPAPLPQLDMFE